MPAAPNFGEFDKLIKLAGLAGTSISILKAAVIYIADHSLDRKARKIGDEIDKDLARLARLDNPNLDQPPVHLELYVELIAFPWIIEDEGYSFEMVFSGLFFVFLVWLFHTDALSRRAKKRLPTLLASAEHPSPAPADLPSTFPAPST